MLSGASVCAAPFAHPLVQRLIAIPFAVEDLHLVRVVAGAGDSVGRNRRFDGGDLSAVSLTLRAARLSLSWSRVRAPISGMMEGLLARTQAMAS